MAVTPTERIEVRGGEIRHFYGSWCEACDGGGGFGSTRDGGYEYRCDGCAGTGEAFRTSCECELCTDVAERLDLALAFTGGSVDASHQ